MCCVSFYRNFAVVKGERIVFDGVVQFSVFDVKRHYLRLDRVDLVIFGVCVILNQGDKWLQILTVRRQGNHV